MNKAKAVLLMTNTLSSDEKRVTIINLSCVFNEACCKVIRIESSAYILS